MELNFESGLKEYTLNGKVTVYFNPTDTRFAERLYTVFEALDKKQEQYKREIEQVGDKKEVFDIANARDAEMREMLNSIFETDVCTPLFGGMNVYALADGLPVWANLMFALMDKMETEFVAEQKRMNPRIEKYTKKYHK